LVPKSVTLNDLERRNGPYFALFHYISALWFLLFLLSSLFFSSPNLSRRRLDVYHTSCRYTSPYLCNQFPSSLRQLHSSPSVSHLPVFHAPATSSYSFNSPLSLSITPLFHSRLNTYLFHKYFPPQTPFRPQDSLHGFMTGPFLLSIWVLFLVSSLLFFVWFRSADLAGYMLAFGCT